MRAFEYASARSKEQAVGLLGKTWDDAAVLAGGTDLLALMKDDVLHPKRLVNVKRISGDAGMTSIRIDGNNVEIGSLMTMGQVADHAEIAKVAPILHEALQEAASPQIRNMATIGGNLCQRPRCWYFRNGMGLLAQQNGESLVLKGDNRYHAVLGNEGPAYFVSPSTVVPVLIAYGAMVRLHGPQGAREVALEKFYRLPKAETEREHDLRPNEIVTGVWFPIPANARGGYYEVRQKEAFDWPMASCAAVLKMNGDTVQQARITLGQVAPVPWLSHEAAQAMIGKRLTEQTAMEAANAALAKAKSLGKNKYKITVAKVAVKRALMAAGNLHVDKA